MTSATFQNWGRRISRQSMIPWAMTSLLSSVNLIIPTTSLPGSEKPGCKIILFQILHDSVSRAFYFPNVAAFPIETHNFLGRPCKICEALLKCTSVNKCKIATMLGLLATPCVGKQMLLLIESQQGFICTHRTVFEQKEGLDSSIQCLASLCWKFCESTPETAG